MPRAGLGGFEVCRAERANLTESSDGWSAYPVTASGLARKPRHETADSSDLQRFSTTTSPNILTREFLAELQGNEPHELFCTSPHSLVLQNSAIA
jgi:hypothetical protein